MVNPGPNYIAENVIRFVSIMCPILRKMQTDLQNLPNILVPKLLRYFVNFTLNILQCIIVPVTSSSSKSFRFGESNKLKTVSFTSFYTHFLQDNSSKVKKQPKLKNYQVKINWVLMQNIVKSETTPWIGFFFSLSLTDIHVRKSLRNSLSDGFKYLL